MVLPDGKEDKKCFLKTIHNAIHSIRTSYDILVRNLPELVGMIVWEDSDTSIEDVRSLWQTLGVIEADALDMIVQLNPRVRDGHIVCNRGFRDKPNLVGAVSSVYLYIWKFQDFSESRFGGQGRALRPLSMALLAGTGIY